RYGPANRGIGDASYRTVAHAFSGQGLKPYAPVHLKGTRAGGGDLTMSWIRRTRIGGDSWEQNDVPLSEDSERYDVDILQGAVVKRTISATTPSIIYTAAQQVLDFGAVQPAVSVRVYQMSALAGRGSPRAATL
ncbi:MAG: hypothetical protein ABL907_10835, partial [Hyphomicrobium sp.]